MTNNSLFKTQSYLAVAEEMWEESGFYKESYDKDWPRPTLPRLKT